jgi:hypothetical protein
MTTGPLTGVMTRLRSGFPSRCYSSWIEIDSPEAPDSLKGLVNPQIAPSISLSIRSRKGVCDRRLRWSIAKHERRRFLGRPLMSGA